MKLTAEEFARGVVTWRGEGIASIQTRTAFSGWSEPLTDPSGSVTGSAPFPPRQMKIKPRKPGEPPREFEVRWCMLQGNQIATLIWRESGEDFAIGVPNLGKFHRIVVATPRLFWEQDSALLVGDVIVRFASQVQGERSSFLEETHSERESTFMSEMGTIALNGKFIEIVAPDINQSAADEAYAVLGLLALVVGDSAVGPVVFSAGIEQISDGTLHEIEIMRDLQMARPVGDEDTGAVDAGLQLMIMRSKARRGVAIGLRWFEHGIRANSDVDKLLAFFVGLETVLTAVTSATGFQSPIRDIAKDERIRGLLEPLVEQHGVEAVDRLALKLTDPQPNAIDRAVEYAKLRRLDKGFTSGFMRLKKLRDDMMHGKKREMDWQVPGQAQELLGQVLRIELGLRSTVVSEPS